MNPSARFAILFSWVFIAFLEGSPAAAQRSAPPPQAVNLETRDGVQLTARYYPSREPAGSAEAKQVTPVIMLHDFKDTQAIYAPLIQRFQQAGAGSANAGQAPAGPPFAIVTVDFRGHGQSTMQHSPAGQQFELDAAQFQKEAFLAMAALDMEQIRSFLVGKNDAGELNLNKLCIIGAGMGATAAVNWAALDWSAPPLAIGKQGQDVKGLVLVSPRWSYRGVTIQDAMKLRPLKQNVAWMLVYGNPKLLNTGNSSRRTAGEDAKIAADVQRIFSQLERFHPEPEDEKSPRDLVLLGWPSSLQGTTLVSQVGEPIETEIVEFLTEHVARKNTPWIPRRTRRP